jgi:polyisoprenoid-binding protein YceI
VRGRFNKFDATLDVGEGHEDTYVSAVIDVASIDTGNRDRDAHVLTDEFLHVDEHPEIRFQSTRITGSGDEWVMEGEVTINKVTKPFTFDVEFGGVGDFAGTQHAGFSAHGDLKRSDFGVVFSPVAEMGLGKNVQFELDLEFVEPSPGE